MKKYKVVSKFEGLLIVKRSDRKPEASLSMKKGDEHVFSTIEEYQMYEKDLMTSIKSGRMKLEVLEGDAAKDIKIDSVTGGDDQGSDDDSGDESGSEAEEHLAALKEEYNALVKQFRETPKKEKEKRKEIKGKADKLKGEIAPLEG